MTTQFFDLMIDTETAGLPPTGALMSIGAVFFDLGTQTMGPTFNRTINLTSSVAHGGAYNRLGQKTPWYWSNERCFRTVRNLYPTIEYDPSQKGEGAHNALADAVFQVEHLFKIKNRGKK